MARQPECQSIVKVLGKQAFHLHCVCYSTNHDIGQSITTRDTLVGSPHEQYKLAYVHGANSINEITIVTDVKITLLGHVVIKLKIDLIDMTIIKVETDQEIILVTQESENSKLVRCLRQNTRNWYGT